MAKKKSSRKSASSKGTRSTRTTTGGRGRAASTPKATSRTRSVRLASVEEMAAPGVLVAVAAAADESIDVGDTVEALVALLSVRPTPPVVVPPGTRGRVSQKSPVGQTMGYIVQFNVNGAMRSAPAFEGQIREV